jgi:hypothetical protein
MLSPCLIKQCAEKIYGHVDTDLQNFITLALPGDLWIQNFKCLFSSLQIVEIRHPKRVACPYDQKQYVLSISTMYLILSCVFIHSCFISLKLLQNNAWHKPRTRKSMLGGNVRNV